MIFIELSDIVGQSLLVDRLKKIISGGRINHAYLFAGPQGIGKKTLSGLFARMLLCRSDYEKPCGHCLCCRQYNSDNHPDLFRLKLQKTSIGVDDIRIMHDHIKTKPYQAGKKIVIIEDAHVLTQQAQNALLKALEEPPEFVVFLLLADRLQGMLTTVQSRCQVFRMQPLSKLQISRIIARRTGVSAEQAMPIAGLSGGIPGKGLKLSSSPEFEKLRAGVLEFISLLPCEDDDVLLGHERFFVDNRDAIESIMDMLMLWFRDVLIYKVAKEDELIINSDMMQLLTYHARIFIKNDIIYIIYTIQRAKKMLKGNANFQLVIEDMLLKFTRRFIYADGGRSAI